MSFVSRGRPSFYSRSSSPGRCDSWPITSPCCGAATWITQEPGAERDGRVAARVSWGERTPGRGQARACAGAVPAVDVAVVSVSPPAAEGRGKPKGAEPSESRPRLMSSRPSLVAPPVRTAGSRWCSGSEATALSLPPQRADGRHGSQTSAGRRRDPPRLESRTWLLAWSRCAGRGPGLRVASRESGEWCRQRWPALGLEAVKGRGARWGGGSGEGLPPSTAVWSAP
jgi:hypothetical protein